MLQVGADFFLQPLLQLEQFIFVLRKVGFRPFPTRRKQPPEFAAAAESAARGFGQFVQGAGALGRGLPEIFERHD
ncbi:MAG: hypothetical protein ABSE90_13670, partial [Verrucomicrobiota bacterium]